MANKISSSEITGSYISGDKTYSNLPAGDYVQVSGEGTSGSGTTSRNVYMKDGITYIESVDSYKERTADKGGGGGGGPTPVLKDWLTAINEATEKAGTLEPYSNPGAAEATKKMVDDAKAGINADPTIDKIDHINTDYQKQLIERLTNAQREQAVNTIDYGTDRSVTELQRNEQDAQSQYQTQLNQVAADERRAMDNQALYSRSRGDNGGIGLSQYNSIQNTAAVNRLTVNRERTKLATDTSRQIADLRAQGEYEKADKLLEISQSYLSQLLDLQQYEQTTNLGIDEFNTEITKWLNEYKLNVQQYLTNTEINAANVTGALSNGTMTQSAYANQQKQFAAAAQALVAAGVAPTATQLEALGLSTYQGADWLSRLYPYG